eukprot:SM000142S00534  [mRNA]  locus=s142:245589:247190:+ [translate_table: standard]
MGFYPGFQPRAFPATPGLEGMGVVEALGDGAAAAGAPPPGTRVVPLLAAYTKAGQGSWQQYVAVAAPDVHPIPDSVPDEVAAQLIVNPFTSYGMLQDLAIPKGCQQAPGTMLTWEWLSAGEYLVQTAANSALGRQLITLASVAGIKTINVVRKDTYVDELKKLGADEIIVSTDEEEIAKRVYRITEGRYAYAAVDSVAGKGTKAMVASVRSGGTVFIFGGASGPEFVASIGDLIFRDVTIRGWWLSRYIEKHSPDELQRLVKEILTLYESGCLEISHGETYDLADFATALKKNQAEGRGGKIILTD